MVTQKASSPQRLPSTPPAVDGCLRFVTNLRKQETIFVVSPLFPPLTLFLPWVQDVERIGDVLSSLGKVEVTLAVLRESKVGATVSKLKKHADEEISKSAKALVKKWKRVAEASGVQVAPAAAAGAAGKTGKSPPSSAGKGNTAVGEVPV